MKKEDAIRVIVQCAKEYHINLENKNLLFIYGENVRFGYLETVFLPRHFMHLTGIIPNKISSGNFYNKCLSGKLSPEDFSLYRDGTTEMKLQVLPNLIKIHRFAKMVGDYDSLKPLLHTEKLAGNITACLGFVRDVQSNYYVPNTALNKDIREVTKSPQQRVLAILVKDTKQTMYSQCSYVVKNMELSDMIAACDIGDRVSLV